MEGGFFNELSVINEGVFFFTGVKMDDDHVRIMTGIKKLEQEMSRVRHTQ